MRVAVLGLGEAGLAEHLGGLWRERADRYSEIRDSGRAPGRHVEMFLVGG